MILSEKGNKSDGRRRWYKVLKKIYQELVEIRKELQAIRNCKEVNVKYTIDGKVLQSIAYHQTLENYLSESSND